MTNVRDTIALEVQVRNLRNIIFEIERRAYDWDGRDSMHYGNAIMKIIHPEWKTE